MQLADTLVNGRTRNPALACDLEERHACIPDEVLELSLIHISERKMAMMTDKAFSEFSISAKVSPVSSAASLTIASIGPDGVKGSASQQGSSGEKQGSGVGKSIPGGKRGGNQQKKAENGVTPFSLLYYKKGLGTNVLYNF